MKIILKSHNMKEISLTIIFAVISILNLSFSLYAQDALNLDFEKINHTTHDFERWNMDMGTTGSTGYIAGIDSATKEQGRYSLFIEKDTTNENGVIGSCINHFLVNFRAKEIELSGFIKTQDVSKLASVIIQLTTANGTVINNQDKLTPAIHGTTGWKEYHFKIPVDANAFEVAIVPNLLGAGKVWFDGFKLYADGIPYDSVQKFTPYSVKPFSRAQLRWLRSNIIPIKSVDQNSSLSDIAPLRKIAGNARIVGLGEFTHGTKEIFSLKSKIIKLLVSRMDFRIIAIEANMADTYDINNYVLTGRGAAKALVNRLFVQERTPEMLNLIEWIRKYNETAKGKVQFIGIDLQTINDAMVYLKSFASTHDKILLEKLDSISKHQYRKPIEGIYNYTINNIDAHKYAISPNEAAWLKQSARILIQADGFWKVFSDRYRDSCMAENVAWILQQNPDEKMILWAHNLHIRNLDHFMGNLLKQRYKDAYLNIGFLGNSGTYTARPLQSGKGILTTGRLASDYEGSYEYRFHQVGIPRFILDLRKVSSTDTNSNWLLRGMKMRVNVGSMIVDNYFLQFRMTNLRQAFDVVIYLDSTHHSSPYDLGRKF